jgi:uncharacterized repeat protein (TIGR01451 family)
MKTISNMSDLASKSLLTVGLGLLLSGGAVVSSRAADAGTVRKLHGHVPAIVSHLQQKGDLPAATDLQLAIGLPLRNCEALTNLLQQIYDPSSTNYHHYLSPEQFAAQFGPTEQDYQAVIHFAQANGLSVTATSPNRMLLNVSGKASKVEKAFNVALHTYAHPSEHRDFYAPDTEPSVPSGLSIQDISGLDNYRRPHPQLKFKPAAQPAGATGSATPAVTPNVGSGPGGNYIGDDFRHAYVPGTTLNGSKQTVGLVQFDGYLASDIMAYENMAGRTNIPLVNVLIDGFNGLPTGTGGEVEVSLDIEMVVAMAPALAQVTVYEGNPFNFHPNNVLNRIATDNSARQISCSWGWTGGPTLTTDQIFQQMAAQGQTFFNASGDSDAYPAGTVDSPFGFGTPSDSAYLTSVGGTTLTMSGAGAAYTSETVWNWGIRYGQAYDGVGSSGAISTYYTIPTWQTNSINSTNQGSALQRNMPDVAMTADDVFVIADGGVLYIGVGGTSVAAPLWAGFTALVNQQATNSNHAPVGFINPAIYSISKSPNYTNCFHDTITGNNKWSGSPNLFDATPGYDLCTGLGTPTGTNLINALTAAGVNNPITHLSPPPPPYGSTLSTLNGGNPNGSWFLFIQDDRQLDSGSVSNGWVLALTTANPVGYSANLVLSMAASTTNLVQGGTVTYTIGVTNYGPSVSSNAIVADTLPSGFTLVSSNSTLGSVTRSGSVVTWRVGTLTNAGAQLVLTAQANVAGINLENTATASADTPDPNPTDNTVTTGVTVAVLVPPQLSGVSVGANGAFHMTVSGSPVQTIVQTSTNLVNWLPIYTNPPPFVSPFMFTDLSATNYHYRFYRAITAQ